MGRRAATSSNHEPRTLPNSTNETSQMDTPTKPKTTGDKVSHVCEACPGRCCSFKTSRMLWVKLTMEEAESEIFRDHVTWLPPVGSLREQPPALKLDPTCPFLGEAGSCTIYEDRPKACRWWICFEHPGYLEENKKLYPEHNEFLVEQGVIENV